jgi:2'-5' RNA ligase
MKIRTFFAIDTPQQVKEKIEELQTIFREARADVKWESREKIHITLKFLGDVEENVLSAMSEKLSDALSSHKQFRLVYQKVGCFPNLKKPRIVWIGCENPDGGMVKVKEVVEQITVPYGFPTEARPFHPHLTIGRVKGEFHLKDLAAKIETVTFEPSEATVTEVLIMKSDLKPTGSVYTVLRRIPLVT